MPSLDFDFAGESGQTLAGRLELPEGKPVAHALFAHCFTCTKESLAAVRLSRALTAAGIGVLRFDFTGLGQSSGSFADSSFSGSIVDLLSAAAALRAQGRAPALLIGHSLGGAAVLAAAAQIPEAAAVATIGAPYDVRHVLGVISNLEELMEKGEAQVRIGGRPFALRSTFIDDLETQDQQHRIAAIRRPLLILHSPVDAVVGIDNAAAVFQAARHPKSFVSLDGADHFLTRREDSEFAARIIAAWATRYLPGAQPPRSRTQSGVVTVTETGGGPFQMEVSAGGVHFLVDEPPEVGGSGSGPTPYDLLAAGLGACTAMTIRLYARGKGLPLDRVTVNVGHSREAGGDRRDIFSRCIRLEGDLDEAQRLKLLDIAGRCPMHRTLERGSRIDSWLGNDVPEERADRPGAHQPDRAQAAGD